jgi:uncharacterized protein
VIAGLMLCVLASATPAEQLAPALPLVVASWGPALFEEARRSGRPVLVVVGDPACPRCRLDEEDALAEPAAVQLLQRAFVVTRVDRLERPDLDDLFATAAVWLSGERGHPLVVALLPDGRPYAARAGITGADRGERPSLHRFALRAWSDFNQQRAAADSRAVQATLALARAQLPPVAQTGEVASAAAALRGLEQSFDARLGGFGAGEAFAPPAALRLLLAVLERGDDKTARRMLERTLDAVGTVEPVTLAGRALLLEAFARADAVAGSATYRARAAALADSALKLRDAQGAFVAFAEPPGDTRVLAGWNGLMIGALALSGSRLDRPQDLEAARTAARVVLDRLGPASRLRRQQSAAGPGALEDEAYLADGLLRLHVALNGRERHWADDAAALVEAAVGRCFDPAQGGFFDAVAGADAFVPAALPQRQRNGHDGALPSANGVMASVLWRLSRTIAQPRYEELARRTVDVFAAEMARAPRGMEGLAAAVVEMQPTVPPEAEPDASLGASEVRDGIRFSAVLAPPGGPPSRLRLSIAIPRGRWVVAHEPGAPDLVGLAVSLIGADAVIAGSVRYPPARRVQGRWDSGTVDVYEDAVAVEVPLRLSSGAARRPERLRVRAVFQVCRDQAAVCDRPDSVLLDAPLHAP